MTPLRRTLIALVAVFLLASLALPTAVAADGGAENQFLSKINAERSKRGLNKLEGHGGLRSAAQMISYEVPQGFALVGPLLLAGTMSLVGIVEAQREAGVWYIFLGGLAGVVAGTLARSVGGDGDGC